MILIVIGVKNNKVYNKNDNKIFKNLAKSNNDSSRANKMVKLILYLGFDKITHSFISILRINLSIRLVKKFSIAVIVKNNEFKDR